MLKVGKKEVVLSKTFLMKNGEEVVMSPPEMGGVSLRIVTKGTTSIPPATDAFGGEMKNGQVTITFPFADQGSVAAEIEYMNLSSEAGKFGCRFAGQAVGGELMLTQLDILLDRTPNFGVR